jgi:acetyl-CoA acetyltransferase
VRSIDTDEPRYGLETMCIGGGQGIATDIERIAD